MKVYLNGRIVPVEEARISPFDHGFLYGDGIFETMRVYGGAVLGFDEHLRRLGRSAALIEMKLPLSNAQFRAAVVALIEENGFVEATVRITVSRGAGDFGLSPRLCATPTVFIAAVPLKPYTEEFRRTGVFVITARTRRNLREALEPRIKSLNFLNNIMAKLEAERAGAFEALMLNHAGHLAECSVSNIFFVKNEAVHTPSSECGILEGITRGMVMDTARGAGLKVSEGMFSPAELYAADEVFLTNTTMEIMPVRRVDDVEYGPPGPGAASGFGPNPGSGKITEKLRLAYVEGVRRRLQMDLRACNKITLPT
jgi:branched-chain amino acid aminotransferase